MKNFALTFILVFLVISCGGFDITKNVSETNPDIITYNTPKIQVKSEYEVQTFFTEIQLFCYRENDQRTYSISNSYVTNQWPFFEKMIFTIDGVEKEFFPDRPPLRDLYNLQGPTETITVILPEETIIDIFESMDTRMTVKGAEIKYTILWKDDMKMKLYEFYKATIEN